MRDKWKWNCWVHRSGVGLYWLGQKLVDGAGVYTSGIEGEENLAFYSLIPVGLEAWSTKKGLTVALWISQVLLT